MASKKLLTNSLIIFPSNEGKSEICDFLYQTCRILAKKNLVIVINIQQAKTVKEAVSGYVNGTNHYHLIKTKEQIHYLAPILLIPFRRFPLVVRLNIVLN